jgi:hypothetical protein
MPGAANSASASAVVAFVAVVESYAFAGSERGASAVGAVVIYESGKCECGCFSAVRV